MTADIFQTGDLLEMGGESTLDIASVSITLSVGYI